MSMNANTISEDKIGAYRVVRTIYPGVTSVVYDVQDSSGKRFALKMLNENRADDASERRAFESEAKLGLSLRHPNLIRYVEYVKDFEQPYFVMDFFPGHHLKLAVAKPKDFPYLKSQLHRIIRQSAAGLAYMHDQGWIHRDVKPENIMANKTGEVRIIDYTLTQRPVAGFAKLFKKKMKLRQGTPSYMSPEQIQLATPAIAADIYSFGITCYELACGRPPFRANSTSELLSKHIKEQPSSLVMHDKEITPEFSDLILKTLKKNPADRPATLHDFLSAFSRLRIYKGDPSPVPARDGF